MKKGLSNRRGEVFTATAVKVIIAVVVGVLILGGLFALYRNVIFPKLNQKVEGMIHTEDTVQVRKDGNSVQYSYDGETWKDCTIPGVSASAAVSTVLTRTYQEKTAFLAVIKDGSGARLYVSRDAQEWVPSIGDSKSVSVGNGTSYVTVSCGDGRSYRSHDGIEWEMTSTEADAEQRFSRCSSAAEQNLFGTVGRTEPETCQRDPQNGKAASGVVSQHGFRLYDSV